MNATDTRKKKYADTSIARLIRKSGMDDAEFAVLARATERTVGGWRRGENLPRLLVFDEIVARLKEMKDAWAVEDARGAGADHEKAAGKAGTENAFGDTAY